MISLHRLGKASLIIFSLIVNCMFSQRHAFASPTGQEDECTKLPIVIWQEQLIGDYAFLYPAGYESIITSITSLIASDFNSLYQTFSQLFNSTLTLPINIRIYPSIESYYCLNVTALKGVSYELHSHIGIHEISLFGDRILNNFSQWENEALDSIRYELGIIFVEQATNNIAPPGLLTGVGVYMMDPNNLFTQQELTLGGIGNPDVSWRYLWESEITLTFPEIRFKAVSIVAYLVDNYGWDTFLRFLDNLRTSEGFTHSLKAIYGLDYSTLQSEWEKYYPLYYQGRWRVHVLYNFDLSPYNEMIASGAYSTAVSELKDVITFLDHNKQTNKIVEANALLDKAKSGLEASDLVLQARHALQNRQYETSIDLSDQAQSIFDQLGDQGRNSELESYRARATEVLALQAEMAQLLQDNTLEGISQVSYDNMIHASQRLAELGEPDTRVTVLKMVQEHEAIMLKRRNQFYIGVSLLVILLLLLRLFMLRLKPPREMI